MKGGDEQELRERWDTDGLNAHETLANRKMQIKTRQHLTQEKLAHNHKQQQTRPVCENVGKKEPLSTDSAFLRKKAMNTFQRIGIHPPMI